MAASSSSSTSSSANNYLKLLSSDQQLFTVAIPAAIQSRTLKQLIEGGGYPSDPIPIFNVDARTLSRVILYMEKHVDESLTSEELATFDVGLIDVSINEIYDLLQAANYLNVPSLLSLLNKKVASLIEGKSATEIRQLLNIRNSGYTREEEAAIAMKLSWIRR